MEFGRQLITPVPARDVTFTHTIDTSRFKLISNSITPTPFEIINDEKIVWKFFEVTKKPVYFSYLVQPIRDGSACIDLESKLSYLRCENKPHRDQLVPSKASVDVFPYGKKEPRPPHKEYVIKEAEPIWQPDHALFISIGHFGRKMLTYVRKNLLDAGNGKMPKGCEFLVVDTAGYESLEGLGNPVAFAGVEIPSADVFMLDENLTKKVENWSNGVPLPDYLTGWFRPDDFVGLGQELNLSAGLFSHRAIPRVALLRHIMKATDINSQWMNEHPKASLEDMVTERVLRLLQENKDLRIFILGALGDGMSGTLIDLTVLIRKNALKTIPEENELHVEGYFLDGPSILKMVPDHRIKEIYLANAYASLREINRWQTARGQRLTLPCISEPLTSGLFDEFIMFTKGKEDNLFMDGFPVMADIVTARLDKATGAGTKNDWFDVMHETRTFRINREHENVVTCANAFTLRLPVNDILRTIHMKWIRQLLIKFLSHNNSGDILFDPNNINDPGIPDDPGVLGCKFLNGEEGISDSSPIESKIIGELINNKTCEKEENSYSSQTWVQKSDDEVKREFEARLAKVVFQIVEGTLESDQGSNAGRLAYAIDFVSKLKNAIDELSGRLAGKPILFRIVSLYQEILYNQGDRLSKLKASLYEDKPDQPPGVYQIIEKDYRGLEKIKDELDQIGSRKYFWGNSTTLDDIEKDENSFVYSWYRDYLSPYYEDCKDLIGWSKTDQEQIDLSVRIKDHPIGLLENGTEAFIDALTQKAENLTRGALAQSSLLNILASHRLLNNDDIGKRLREQVDLSTSRLFISVDPGINAGVLYRMAIPGIEQGIVHTEFMNGLNQDPTDSAIALGEATPLASTDQFAITLLRLIDAVRVDRLRSSVSSKDAYLQSKDQINSVQYEEVTAKLIERLEHYPHDVNAVIHPFVVQALANPDNAELFCLALAEGFIKVDPGDRIVLEIGQLNELITNERRNYIDQIIDAMIIFSENKDQKFTGHIRWLTTHYDSNQNIDRDRLIKWANWPANIDEPWMNELPENRSLQMLLKTFTTNYLRSRRRWMN
jgi:hypothetical protein